LSLTDLNATLDAPQIPLWVSREKGKAFPNVKFLAMIDHKGFDVLYVITGNRTGDVSSLSDREGALLDSFRYCDEELKATLEKLAAALGGPATPGESYRTGLALGEALASVSKYILKHGKLR